MASTSTTNLTSPTNRDDTRVLPDVRDVRSERREALQRGAQRRRLAQQGEALVENNQPGMLDFNNEVDVVINNQE